MYLKMKVVFVVFIKGGEGKLIQVVNFGGFFVDVGIKIFIIDGDYVQFIVSSIYLLVYEVFCGLYELFMQIVDLLKVENIIFCIMIDNFDVIVFNDF